MGKGARRTYENIRVNLVFFYYGFKPERGAILGENQCTPDRPCTAVQLLVQSTENHEKEMEKQDKRMDKMDELLESVRNRLPLWATLALTAAGGTIGLLAGHVKF